MSEFDARQQLGDAANTARELEATQRELKLSASQIKDLEKQLGKVEFELGVLERIGHVNKPPKWLKATPKARKGHKARPFLMLSDLHLDEVVRPEEMQGINKYDRPIAEMRLERAFQGALDILKNYWTNIEYDGIVLPLGGDIFGGNIHEELARTNADTVLGTLDYWHEPFIRGITALADEFGKVHIPVVAGNHGRTTMKKSFKNYSRTNYDWYFGKSMQRVFADDDRVTFDVSDSSDVMIPCYDRNIMMTHGDQTGGGGGIGGIWPPIMRMNAKKIRRQVAIHQPYDILIMGHWHQLVFGQGFIINGSMKGYDEFAFGLNFPPEPPQQALWLMTPERGMTWRTEVQVADREKEGW